MADANTAINIWKLGFAENPSKGEDLIHKTLYGKAHEGVPGAMDPVRFCRWIPPEYGQEGENIWTMVFQAAQVGIAITNALIQGQIADLKEDLAEGYYQQAKYKWNRFNGNYRPLEEDILREASTEPIREMNCIDDRARAEEAGNPTYDYMQTYMGNTARAYRMCLDDTMIRQMDFARNKTLVDTENYNLRDDQWFVDFKNDQRWNRRSNILNLGRNLGAVAMQYGDVARKLMGDVSDIANKAFGSISQALGYYGAKFDTVYPTTFLSGTSESLVTTHYSGTSYGPGSGVNGAI